MNSSSSNSNSNSNSNNGSSNNHNQQEEVEVVTEDSNSAFSVCSTTSTSTTSSLSAVKESLPLKRTQAIPDLHTMDDFSPVTFESSLVNCLLNKQQLQTSSSIATTVDDSLTEDTHQNAQVDYIEETKIIIPGIKVRAAKLSKLIQILVESFDETTGDVLPNIDFPRVFFLMHKWFMESDELANMIYELYVSCEKQQQTECSSSVCSADSSGSTTPPPQTSPSSLGNV